MNNTDDMTHRVKVGQMPISCDYFFKCITCGLSWRHNDKDTLAKAIRLHRLDMLDNELLAIAQGY